MQLVGFCSVRHQLALADLAGLWETHTLCLWAFVAPVTQCPPAQGKEL